jgi:CheY-like chemotaxis protein
MLVVLLADMGVEARGVAGGPEALDQVRRECPDVVFMDIRMPGMNGIEAAGRLWREVDRSRLKIVAISASVMAHERQQFLSAGFDTFIGKPFRDEQIWRCLADLLHVEFEEVGVPRPGGDDHGPLSEEELSGIVLPEALFRRCLRAARLHNLTELKRCVNEMETLGESGRRLGEYLRSLSQRYDIEGVLTILNGIGHE